MKRSSPAVARNREPLLEVLRQALPAEGRVLEIASGTGEHAAYFARQFPKLIWQPSDAAPDALESIAAWQAEQARPNLLPPLKVDVLERSWWEQRAQAMLCINMVHISPWEATRALFAGAAHVLQAPSPLILYGPYLQRGVETAPSNLAFDAQLKSRDPAWGLRQLEDVAEEAERSGFALARTVPMPSNNLTVIFERSA